MAKLQFERRQGRGSGGSGGGGAAGARGTPYNGACGWPAFRWNWIGNLPWLVSITKGLVALDKGCFSNAQNQSLYGLGALFPPAIQVFLQWSLIKSVKTKLRVISAPPHLLLQSRKRKRDQTLRKANSWVNMCAYLCVCVCVYTGCWMHYILHHSLLVLKLCRQRSLITFFSSALSACEQLVLSDVITEQI